MILVWAMAERAERPDIVILENRQTIAAILADLLEEAGYRTHLTSDPEQAQAILPQCLPALLLADLGMIRPEQRPPWEELRRAAEALEVPLLLFSCSPLDEGEGLLVLRSPADFATIVQRVEEEWHRKQPPLGMTLVEMGVLSREEVETLLSIQRELAHIGRRYSLGDLLVRLDIADPETVERALQSRQ
jgi:CheY-like chemotaxis protein